MTKNAPNYNAIITWELEFIAVKTQLNQAVAKKALKIARLGLHCTAVSTELSNQLAAGQIYEQSFVHLLRWVQTGATLVGPADVGCYWQLFANGCNNSQWCKNGQCILGRIGALRVCKLINLAVMLMRCCLHGDHMWCACVAPTMIAELCKRIQHCFATHRWSQNKTDVGNYCWKFDEFQTSRNNAKQHAKRCKRVCRRTQHVAEDLRQQWPEPGCWPAVFVKTMVCWGC